MQWTDAQKKTIETRERNILVSAAAGSGKTAVLIERIRSLVLEDKIDIDRFLITTFTNAASAEMKARLEKSIREQMEKPGADRQFLKRQHQHVPYIRAGSDAQIFLCHGSGAGFQDRRRYRRVDHEERIRRRAVRHEIQR